MCCIKRSTFASDSVDTKTRKDSPKIYQNKTHIHNGNRSSTDSPRCAYEPFEAIAQVRKTFMINHSREHFTDDQTSRYVQEQETTQDLPWADLVTLDLSKFDQEGGKQALAAQLKDAVNNVGFFYITNFGLSQDEVDEQFAIGREFFALPTDEKMKYKADLANGNYNGYRPKGSSEVLPGKRDNVEMLNVFKYLPELDRNRPEVIEENRESIEKFQRKIAEDIVQKLLVLIAIILEMPEDTLTDGHQYDDVSECHLRYMIYRHRTAEENKEYQNLYSKGHSDFGSLTLLFRQPVAALQIRMPDGSWRYVSTHQHHPD